HYSYTGEGKRGIPRRDPERSNSRLLIQNTKDLNYYMALATRLRLFSASLRPSASLRETLRFLCVKPCLGARRGGLSLALPLAGHVLEDAIDGRVVIRQEADAAQPRREGLPVRVHGEDLAEQRQRLVDSLHVDQRDGVPVDRLGVVGDERLGRAVGAQGAFV